MDAIYRHQRHIYDVTRRFFLLGRERAVRDLRPPQGGTVLEIACGTGRNLIKAARLYPSARLYGLDLSGEMLKTARGRVARAGLAHRIELAQADATMLDGGGPFGTMQLDRVLVSYALSMIPQWELALAAAMSLVAPGGRLIVVDFGQQQAWPALWKRGLLGWLARFSVHPDPALGDAIAAIAARHGAQLGLHQLYGGYAIYAVVDMPSERD